MEEEKPYLESKITLPQLANRFETNPNYLSQVINEKLNQNLYDFINRYRVEELKKGYKMKTYRITPYSDMHRIVDLALNHHFMRFSRNISGKLPLSISQVC